MTSSEIVHSLLLKRLKAFIYIMGDLFYLTKTTLSACFSRPFYFRRVVEQVIALGLESLPITIVIGLAMGLVMTLNFGYGLAKFGGTLYVPRLVSLSLFREMAPIFTSLLIAGRIGSGMAAEIGSMNVTQQIDAIRALGTSPIRVLVVPRFLASLISLPLLTALAAFLGVLGGMVVCASDFDIPPSSYWVRVLETVKFRDFLTGLLKAFCFGGIISIFGCYKGLVTKEGTKGVGESTTWVVVMSSITILISDFFLSKIFIVLWLQK